MKKTKIAANLYYIASMLMYITALCTIFSKDTSTGILWLCLGSAMLCLGATLTKRYQKEQEEMREDQQKQSLTK